jgi:hypothetical protein
VNDTGTLGLLGLLLALFGLGERPSPARGGGGSRPAPSGSPTINTTPAPWPQVVPDDLERFPGPGWEYDEPPPPAVQQRAAQLVSQLWKQGSGSYKTEQTAGRWITYQAQKVRSGKNGVVAYRLKGSSTTAAPPGGLEQSRAPAPAPARPRPAPPRLVTSPGLPQAPGRAPSPAPVLSEPTWNVSVQPAVMSPLPSPLGMPDLKYGDGLLPKAPLPDVVLVQQKLGIKSDGRFGNETRDAVIAFQVKTGLAPNQPLAQLRARGFGAVKQATWVKLFAVQV